MTIRNKNKCACGSNNNYAKCCAPFHQGKQIPQNAETLMRSRYSAYAKSLVDYIIETTHPDHEEHKKIRTLRKQEILAFSHHTEFIRLEVQEFLDGEKTAYVTFRAYLSQNNQDASFMEKSCFKKLNGKWFYHSGKVSDINNAD